MIKLTKDDNYIENILTNALLYKNKCIAEKRIPLEDISDKIFEAIGMKK